MRKLFKRTQLYIKDFFLECLLWIMRNVWTNYYFMLLMKYLCLFPVLQKVGWRFLPVTVEGSAIGALDQQLRRGPHYLLQPRTANRFRGGSR